MNEEEQRKVREGLAILTKDILDKLNKSISEKRLDGLDGAIYYIKSAKRIFDVIEVGIAENYFSSGDFSKLKSYYSDLFKMAEEVFVRPEGKYDMKIFERLTNAIK